jgi:hypothetical protein
MRNWLAVFADHFMSDIPAAHRPAIIEAVETELRPQFFRDGVWLADYCRLRIAARK